MPDDATPPPPAPPNATTAPSPSEPPIPFHIGEEFGTAKKNLPSIKIVLICVAVIAAIAAIFAFVQRPQSATTGSMDNVASVEVPNQNMVMVAINVTVKNNGEKPYWIHTIKADLLEGARSSAPGPRSQDQSWRSNIWNYSRSIPRYTGSLRQSQIPEGQDPALRSTGASNSNQVMSAALPLFRNAGESLSPKGF